MTEAEWLACDDPAAMLNYLTAHYADRVPTGKYTGSNRKLRLFACACCRAVWHLLTDERSRAAVEIAERYADGLVTDDELGAARDVACNAACNVVWNAGGSAAWIAAWATTVRAIDAAELVTSAAALAVGVGQATLLRDIIGNPFQPASDGDWLHDATALGLAQAAYNERLPDGTLDPVRLAVLADAMEEAGCVEERLLDHLRGFIEVPQPGGVYAAFRPGRGLPQAVHVCGCWVIDLILGKE